MPFRIRITSDIDVWIEIGLLQRSPRRTRQWAIPVWSVPASKCGGFSETIGNLPDDARNGTLRQNRQSANKCALFRRSHRSGCSFGYYDFCQYGRDSERPPLARVCTLAGVISHFSLHRHFNRVIDLDAEVSSRAFRFRVAKEQLHRSEIFWYADRSATPSFGAWCAFRMLHHQGRLTRSVHVRPAHFAVLKYAMTHEYCWGRESPRPRVSLP
jgi:hypothetical protein